MLILNKESKEVLLSGRNAKEKKYKIILTTQGRIIYKGGNLEVMNKILNFEFISPEKKAKDVFYNKVITTLGSGSLYLFGLE